MNGSAQKVVMTPGQNKKAYLAGTLDARSGEVLWVGGALKDSSLFVAMLEKLDCHYPRAKRIHVILDNYGIHKSVVSLAALIHAANSAPLPATVLPGRRPHRGPLARLHANVTRNHKHARLPHLCQDVATYLRYASPWQHTANAERPPARLAA
jgi:transposase